MQVTVVGWLLAALAVVAVGALFVGVLAIRHRADPEGSAAEWLLGTTLIVVLTLYAEVELLSRVPVARPLDWLPLAHVLGSAALLAWLRRRHGPGALLAAPRQILGRLWPWFRRIGWITGIGAVGVALLMLIYLAAGLYVVQGAWDALSYHVPMAFQPYQDGRVGPMDAFIPTAGRLYPRGCEHLWYWTLQFTHTDLLFNPVQLAFGVQLLLGVYVLARRTGARPREATLGAIALATMPLFFMLVVSGYTDMAVAASIVATLAFLAPRPQSHDVTADWALAAAGFAEACLIKYPMLACVLVGLALAEPLFLRTRPAQTAACIGRFIISRRALAAAVFLALGLPLYVRYGREYGNPFYPYRIVVAGHELLRGPHDPGPVNLGGQTTAQKPIGDMGLFERYYRAWTDFDAPLSVESFGSFGPVLPFGLLLPAAGFAVAALLRRNTWRLALVGGILVCLFFTPVAVPRYGFAVIAVLAACAVCVFSELPRRTGTGIALGLLLLAWPNVQGVVRELTWLMGQAAQTGGVSWTRRTADRPERVEVAPTYTCSPALIHYVRHRCPAGALLVWNVDSFPALLLNKDWSNRICMLPGSPRELWPGTPGSPAAFIELSSEEMAAWIGSVQRLAPRYVLVYKNSAYARFLRGHPELGYGIAYEDAPERGDYQMTLFDHEAGGVMPGTASAPAPPPPASAPTD